MGAASPAMGPVLPFVAEPPGSDDDVLRAATIAAVRWRLPPPVLVRTSMTGVCTAGDDPVVRGFRPPAPPEVAIALADVLTEAGVPVARPVRRDVVRVGDLAVVAVERLHPTGEPVDWCRVGRAVAAVHDLDPARLPDGVPRPRGLDFPWWRLDALMTELAADLDEAARRGLAACLDRHRVTVEAARRLPVDALVVCHGDVHDGNVVQTAAGPVLIDWDLLCLEQPGWDHAALRTWASRWGGTPGAYEAFVDGSGERLDDDPYTDAVTDLRLVAATLLRVRAGRRDPAAASEAHRRLAFWRGDADAPTWRAM
jgi:Ser/Thr protein kinase RdoA (MazF antagonist)